MTASPPGSSCSSVWQKCIVHRVCSFHEGLHLRGNSKIGQTELRYACMFALPFHATSIWRCRPVLSMCFQGACATGALTEYVLLVTTLVTTLGQMYGLLPCSKSASRVLMTDQTRELEPLQLDAMMGQRSLCRMFVQGDCLASLFTVAQNESRWQRPLEIPSIHSMIELIWRATSNTSIQHSRHILQVECPKDGMAHVHARVPMHCQAAATYRMLERKRFTTSIQPAWLMRTRLCSCLSLLQQGNETLEKNESPEGLELKDSVRPRGLQYQCIHMGASLLDLGTRFLESAPNGGG